MKCIVGQMVCSTSLIALDTPVAAVAPPSPFSSSMDVASKRGEKKCLILAATSGLLHGVVAMDW